MLTRPDWLRIGLIAPFVLACYQFGWRAWREFNCTVFLSIAHALNIPAVRVNYEMFATRGQIYRFATACTALDAFFGSIPLLWEPRKSIQFNLSFLLAYFIVLMTANMLRLTFGMLIFLWGVPWWLSHEVLAGVCYFILFLWIARRRNWTISLKTATERRA